MKTLAKNLAVPMGLLLLAIAIGAIWPDKPASASTTSAPVTVVNTPLPVQGSVSVANTPGVNVANTPTVSVGNTPNVNIANSTVPVSGNVTVGNTLDSSNNPIAVTVNQQGQPYMDGCSGGNATSSAGCDMNAVPSGMRLVIQAVSVNTTSAQGNVVYSAQAFTLINNLSHFMYLPLSNTGTNSSGELFQSAHLATAMYSDPGSKPSCFAVGTGPMAIMCSISGYLLPAQ